MPVKSSWSVGSSPEDVFRSLTIYLSALRVKTVVRCRPSCVRAEIGSWFSFIDQGNAKGEVEATITRRDGGSRVCLNFNFAKECSLGFSLAVLGSLPFLAIGATVNSVLTGLLGSLAVSALVVVAESCAVSNTKRKVADEFDALMQLLKS